MRRRLVLTALALLAVGVVFVPLGAARALDGGLVVPGDMTVPATSPSGAVVSFTVTDDPGFVVSCDHSSGETFPFGDTLVSCTSTDSSDPPVVHTGSFHIKVVDTTSPVVTVPSDISVTTTDPNGTAVTFSASANDDVDGPITPTCSPASGATFPVGSTTVTCSATDAHNNTGSASFHVTVNLVDNQPPTFTSVPNDATVEATGPDGAPFGYSITASDNADPSPSISCDHPSGSTFPLGTTAVHCTATDNSGNSAQASFSVTVQDTTPPTLSLPADMTVPVGTTVTFSASAHDLVDGSVAVNCSPSSGSAFPLGTTTVSCDATDAHSNKATGTFHVTVKDVNPPVLSNVPGPIKVEANSHAGSVVNFATPTATDDVDGLIANVACAPSAGSTFALGTTTVTCSATDSSGNTGTASFTVEVVDTTPPRLIPPGDRNVYATYPAGIYDADEAANAFLGGFTVSDLADAHPVVTNDAPNFFLLGVTTVTFTARDASGNTSKASAQLNVLPMPEPATTPPPLPPPKDRTPPGDVTNVDVTSGDGVVTITWADPSDADFDHTEITRATTNAGAEPQVVYSGKATSLRDKGVQNGVEYRYVITAVDKAGNDSAGVVAVAFPKASGLLAPKAGARLRKAVKFEWKKVKGAKYYNLQAFYGSTRVLAATADAKVLSAWPTKPSFVLKKTWKYAGHKRTLKPGVYTWYVWPGFGPRSAAEYGELIGSRSFTVVR